MGAGDGAAEQARLAAQRAARLRRQLDHAERAERAWAAGAAGEARVADAVAPLNSLGWRALHDVHWPGRPKANLDHVLVGPGGIIVIDSKNWTGDVHLRGGILRQNGYSREREVSGIFEQCAAVAALLEPRHRRHVQAWLCMVAQPNLSGVSAAGARIQGLDSLCDAIGALPAVLDSAEVGIIHAYLSGMLGAGSSPSVLSTRHLPSGEPDFAHELGPTVALQQWRGARHDAATVRTPRPPKSSRPRRKVRKSPSCFGVLFRLAAIIFFLGVLLNLLTQVSQSVQKTPVPVPTVVSTPLRP